MLTSLARSAFSLGIFRFLLGLGEAGNYTAAPKAVSEWVPPKDRALAVGIYTSGATMGATIAPPLIARMGTEYGLRATFVITACFGYIWLVPWAWLYRSPHRHWHITPKELALVPPPEPSKPAGKKNEWAH